MPTWLSTALRLAWFCFLALVAYDTVARLLLGQVPVSPIPAQTLACDVMLDLGLAVTYSVLVTPRILPVIAPYPARPRRLCLLMLGLGLAWWVVICAFATRELMGPPGILLSLVLLFVIPVVMAPWYVRWLRTKTPGREDRSGSPCPD
ncbi:MAG: hypothetical protein ACREI3_01030 [Nitrospirales bacterium]